MKRALVIISRDLNKGSTQYRFVQYEQALAEQGLQLSYIHRKDIDANTLQRLHEYDVVINQKCLLPIGLAKKIRKQSRRLLFDIDDAVYTRPGKPYGWLTGWRVRRRLHWWLRHVDLVMPANRFLADYISQFTSHVAIVPMALDLNVWQPAAKQQQHGLTIGWTGSPANLPKLQAIGEQLAELLASREDCRFALYCGERPTLPFEFDYTPFSPGSEAAFVQQLDIGLLPLSDEPFSRGKSPIKALQYLSCGVPLVGNSIGASAELFDPDYTLDVATDGDWVGAIKQLLDNPNGLADMRQAARLFIERQHNLDIVAKDLYRLLTGE